MVRRTRVVLLYRMLLNIVILFITLVRSQTTDIPNSVTIRSDSQNVSIIDKESCSIRIGFLLLSLPDKNYPFTFETTAPALTECIKDFQKKKYLTHCNFR